MLAGAQSGCINHPGIEAEVRCKQCNTPVCGKCVIVGVGGNFCSPVCRERFEKFLAMAREYDQRRGTRFMHKVRMTLGFLVAAVAMLIAVGFVGTIFYVPLLTPLVIQVRGFIGI